MIERCYIGWVFIWFCHILVSSRTQKQKSRVANQGQDARQQDAGEKQIIHRKEVKVWNKRLVQVKTGSEDETSWN